MHDIIIRGGTVFDGSGAPGQVGDVAISDGLIVAVGGSIAGNEIVGSSVIKIQTRFLPMMRSGHRAGHMMRKWLPYLRECARTPTRNSLRSRTLMLIYGNERTVFGGSTKISLNSKTSKPPFVSCTSRD